MPKVYYERLRINLSLLSAQILVNCLAQLWSSSQQGPLLRKHLCAFFGCVYHSRDSRPIPFVRLDALFLLLSWSIPFFPVSGHTLNDALRMAALFMLMSGSWAAGDVSLNASLQADFIFREDLNSREFASIMSFLYVAYVSMLVCAPSHIHNSTVF